MEGAVAARRVALLGLLLLCLGGCAAGTAPAPEERVAVSARGGRVGPTAWTGDEAIAALRRRLATRGFARDVTAGPMVALWSEEAPASRLRAEPAVPLRARRGGSGAWLVVTDAGAWWVWESDDLGPVPVPGMLLD
jgi:hypothetical protein